MGPYYAILVSTFTITKRSILGTVLCNFGIYIYYNEKFHIAFVRTHVSNSPSPLRIMRFAQFN